MEPEEEKRLVDQAKHDQEAFGQLFDFYYPKILNYLVRRTGDVELSRDISSETFFRAFDRLWQFQWRAAPFSAWLYRIAINRLNGYYRQQGKRQTVSFEAWQEETGFDIAGPVDLQAELEEAEEELARHSLFLAVREELARLPLKYQEALSLKYFENRKISEIAQILGKKEGTIKSLLSRGLKKLEEKTQLPKENSIIMIGAEIRKENI